MKHSQESTPPALPVQLVSPARAAEMLAISERKLWDLSKHGRIRHLRIDRGVKYDVADLAAWVEERKEGGAKP